MGCLKERLLSRRDAGATGQPQKVPKNVTHMFHYLYMQGSEAPQRPAEPGLYRVLISQDYLSVPAAPAGQLSSDFRLQLTSRALIRKIQHCHTALYITSQPLCIYRIPSFPIPWGFLLFSTSDPTSEDKLSTLCSQYQLPQPHRF